MIRIGNEIDEIDINDLFRHNEYDSYRWSDRKIPLPMKLNAVQNACGLQTGKMKMSNPLIGILNGLKAEKKLLNWLKWLLEASSFLSDSFVDRTILNWLINKKLAEQLSRHYFFQYIRNRHRENPALYIFVLEAYLNGSSRGYSVKPEEFLDLAKELDMFDFEFLTVEVSKMLLRHQPF